MSIELSDSIIGNECLQLLVQGLQRRETSLADDDDLVAFLIAEGVQDLHVEFRLPVSAAKLSLKDFSRAFLQPAADQLLAWIERYVWPSRRLIFYPLPLPEDPEMVCVRSSSIGSGCSARFLWHKVTERARLSVLFSTAPAVVQETGIERYFRENSA